MEISPAAVRKLRQALEDQTDGVVDELGLLALHTGYGERFFPGTSVLQTRARYLFFVAWTYLTLASSSSVTAANVRERKQREELRLTERLKAHAGQEAEGIIGTRVFPSPPAQPPDFVYWTALRTYGLYDGVDRSSLLSRWDRRRILRRDQIQQRDEEPRDEPLAIFDVPDPPDGWPANVDDVSFILTRKEAERLRDGFRRPGSNLLAAAADALGSRTKPSATGQPWDDRFLIKVANDIGEGDALKRASQVAYLAQIARCTYAAHVEILHVQEARAAGATSHEDGHHYQDLLRELLDEGLVFDQAAALDIDAMKQDIAIPPHLESLVVRLRDAVRKIRRPAQIQTHLLDNATREALRQVETRRKGSRARLHFIHGRARREGFGEKSIAVEPLHYRWRVARRLLLDLHEGLFT